MEGFKHHQSGIFKEEDNSNKLGSHLFFTTVQAVCNNVAEMGRRANFGRAYFSSHSPRPGRYQEEILKQLLDEGKTLIAAASTMKEIVQWKRASSAEKYMRSDVLSQIPKWKQDEKKIRNNQWGSGIDR